MLISKQNAGTLLPSDPWALPAEGRALTRDFVEDRLAFARGHANWYRRKKRSAQFTSKALRLTSIGLLTLGGIVPLLSQAGVIVKSEAGYILLALGGACLLADRIFGISAGWARYMVAAMDIEGLAENFRASVVEIESKASTDGPDAIMRLCAEFTENIVTIVCSETGMWVKEFSNGRDELTRIATPGGR